MKRIFSLLVAFALLSIPLAAADADAPKAVLGDVTGDGLITAEDALLALQAATGKIDLTKEQKALAEVDGVEGISANDALLILQAATKKIGSFPATPSPEVSTPDGVLTCQREGDEVTATVRLAACAKQEVSLLALSDRQYQYTWWETPDVCLSDIAQLTLDEQGYGEITLKLKAVSDPTYIILTTANGSYILEVK